MTSAFIALAALMLIAALAFVLVPLLRGRGRAGFGAGIAVVLLLPLAAIVLYREIGAPQALDPANLVARADDQAANLEAAIAQLSEKMKQEPNNAEGWALLGRAYKSTRRFAEARDALKHAHDLAPGDADLMVDYAEALIFTDADHRIQGAALALIEQAIKTNPQNQKGLWLAGIADSQAGKYDEAVKKWNVLLPLLPPDSDVAASVHEQIAQAQALRDGKAPSADTGPAPQISVKVALDPKLKDKVAPTDTLFVFAKAASGPPMPLAIAKLTAAQLPASVTLTDAMSMVPNMKVSAFAQIVVGARISKSGQAIAQSGDLQALSAPLPNTRTEPVELTIDQTVP